MLKELWLGHDALLALVYSGQLIAIGLCLVVRSCTPKREVGGSRAEGMNWPGVELDTSFTRSVRLQMTRMPVIPSNCCL